MGIVKREGGGVGAVFFKINSKEGCFQQGSGPNKIKYEPGNTDLTGTLIGFKIDENEFEGQKSEEIRLVFRDTEPGQPNMHVSLSIASAAFGASSLGLRTLARLNAADLTQPISLRPWFAEAGTKMGELTVDKDMAGVTVYQGGFKPENKLIEDYGNGISKLPDLPKVKVGNKEVVDKSPWDDLLNDLLEKVAARLPKEAPKQAASEAHAGIDVEDAAAAARAVAAESSAAAPADNRPAFRQRA